VNAEERAWEERDQAYSRVEAFLAGVALGLLIALVIVLVGAP
jgi:hypothetical protein